MTALLAQHGCSFKAVHSQLPSSKPQLQRALGNRAKADPRFQYALASRLKHDSQYCLPSAQTAVTASSQQPITEVPRLQTGNEHLDGKLKIIGMQH